ncbi:MAG: prepilin-type N-terminal cleavage/methylation domain-containing protein [bacterium]|nr:prepilin-type N-terminal cleavage/methylation domain-containing protein [bacterium]
MQKFSKGFSLVEVMVAIAISSILLAAINSLFHKQIVSHNTQRQVVSMQRNVRAALSFMESDIRMAGYDPKANSGAAILIANGAQLRFQSNLDQNETIGAGESITYALDNDADGNGISNGLLDGTPCNLVRDNNDGNGLQIVSMNIDALNFDYFDAAGNSLTDKSVTPWAVPAAQIADISSVQVSIIARSGARIPAFFVRFTDSNVYRNRNNDIILPAQNDGFRRMQLTSEIDCRNHGI